MDKKDIQNLANQYKDASSEKEQFLRDKQVPEDALAKVKGAVDGEADEGADPLDGESITGNS